MQYQDNLTESGKNQYTIGNTTIIINPEQCRLLDKGGIAEMNRRVSGLWEESQKSRPE